MTADYNPTEAQSLIAGAREDDARMTRAPWTTPTGTRLLGSVTVVIDGRDRQVAAACGQAAQFDDSADVGVQLGINAAGIARSRNNLRALADQLEAAGREVERLEGLRDTWSEGAVAVAAERDSLRQQLEAAHAKSEEWRQHYLSSQRCHDAAQREHSIAFAEREHANDWCARIKPEYEKLQTDLAAAQRRIAELEQVVTGYPVALGALLKVKDQRIAELEAKVEGLRFNAKNDLDSSHKQDAEIATLVTALRAILPVYRAAEEVHDEQESFILITRAVTRMIFETVRDARSAITPEIAAVLAGLETP